MNVSHTTFAGLKCCIIDQLSDQDQPACVVVLCHGFGAPGDDLVGIGAHLLESSAGSLAKCRFVFPEAPIDLTPMGLPGGRAWWPINMALLAEISQTRDYGPLTEIEPPGMAAASEQLAAAVREIQSANEVQDESLILGGFSQGAMVTTNLVLQFEFIPALHVIFSGTLLCRAKWEAAAAKHPGCDVLQSHGRQDPILPYEPAEWLRDLLVENGFRVTFCPFDGPHTIDPAVLARFGKMLTELPAVR